MDMVLVYSTALKLGFALLGLLLTTKYLGHLDNKLGKGFRVMHNIIDDHPVALGIYYAGRFIGVCILVGLAVM